VQREARLADAADADDRDQAPRGQQRLDLDQIAFATDERSRGLTQLRGCNLRWVAWFLDSGDNRTDETVATPRERFDPVFAAWRLRQHAANRVHLHRHVAFFDDDRRAGGVDEAFLRAEPVRVLDEDREHRHTARIEHDRRTPRASPPRSASRRNGPMS
jgi:hypothetical protein